MNTLNNIGIITGCISAITGIALFVHREYARRLTLPTPMRLFIIYTLVGALSDIVGRILAAVIQNNILQHHIYGLIDFILIIWILSFWTNSRRVSILMQLLIIPGFATLWLLFKLIGLEGWTDLNSLSIPIRDLGVLFFSLYALSYISKRSKVEKLYENPYWLICTFIAFFHLTHFLTFFLFFYIASTLNTYVVGLWYIFSGVNILTNFVYVYAYYLYWKSETDVIVEPVGSPETTEAITRIQNRIDEHVRKHKEHE